MKQVKKFYLASFLKNQIYFVPIIVLFFQDLGLSYSDIFWVFTIGSAFSFIIEIPSGIIADIYGNRKSIIYSKLLIFISFIVFSMATGFLSLLIANLIYELGKSFRSGTETAYVYNYLDSHPGGPKYSKVKIEQKFYARISESLAALVGGFIAYRFGFSLVFLAAALPALINFIQTLTWEKIPSEENRDKKGFSMLETKQFVRAAFGDIFSSKILLSVILNISLFSLSFSALDKFIQPYMKGAGIELQNFGLIYSFFLILVALIVKFSAKLEDKLGEARIMNYSSIIAALALVVLAILPQSIWLVVLFFVILMIDNLRSPIANSLFHDQIGSEKRATMGSILELFKSANQLWFLPLMGYMADFYSMKMAFYIISFVLILSFVFLYIDPKKSEASKLALKNS